MELSGMNPNHEVFLKLVGDKVRELRKSKKILINTMAQDMSMSRNAISQLERGKTYWKVSQLLKILDYLGIEYTDFIKVVWEKENDKEKLDGGQTK